MGQIPASTLMQVCRSLRHLLEAGIALPRAWQQLAKKGPVAFRSIAQEVADSLGEGENLETALAPLQHRLPALFSAAVAVGERTGRLPEVLLELEQAFTLQVELRRQFWSRVSWPLFQFVAAVLVLALFIWLLGVVESVAGTSPISLFGLKGERGAIIFLTSVALLTLGPYVVVRFLFQRGRRSVLLYQQLLHLPVLGSALQALAEARLAQALAVALDSGLVVHEAAALALQATGNPAFARWAKAVSKQVRHGRPLSAALADTFLVSSEFLAILTTAEVAGAEPDALRRHAQHRYEQAADKLRLCTGIAAGAVWLIVVIFIASLVVRLFSGYVQILNEFSS